MEEWDFVDDRDLQGWKGGVVCMTCQHFAYGVDRHCHTVLACNLRQRQLAQGDHLKKRCKLWRQRGVLRLVGLLRLVSQSGLSFQQLKLNFTSFQPVELFLAVINGRAVVLEVNLVLRQD